MSVSAGVPSTRRTLPVATLASVRAQTSALHQGDFLADVAREAPAGKTPG